MTGTLDFPTAGPDVSARAASDAPVDDAPVDDGAGPEDGRHFAPIAAAINYLAAHYTEQPELAEIAAVTGLHPHHFQRVFKRWAGISPKRFAQYLTLEHAKRLLDAGESVLGAALEVGLSGPSRLHDLFIVAEAMTPGAYKSRGAGLVIRVGVHPTPFGRALIGLTDRGIHLLRWFNAAAGGDGMDDGPPEGWDPMAALSDRAAAVLVRDQAATAPIVEQIFDPMRRGGLPPLHLRGTNFQIQVWQALLRIPPGSLVSYRQVAAAAGYPRAARAVGQAVGANPVAVLIPCHRVLRATGVLGGYRWGPPRKRALLAWEVGRREAAEAEDLGG